MNVMAKFSCFKVGLNMTTNGIKQEKRKRKEFDQLGATYNVQKVNPDFFIDDNELDFIVNTALDKHFLINFVNTLDSLYKHQGRSNGKFSENMNKPQQLAFSQDIYLNEKQILLRQFIRSYLRYLDEQLKFLNATSQNQN